MESNGASDASGGSDCECCGMAQLGHLRILRSHLPITKVRQEPALPRILQRTFAATVSFDPRRLFLQLPLLA